MTNKYDDLKEEVGEEVGGARHHNAVSNFLWTKGELTIIRGYPLCPECGHVMVRVWEPTSFTCNECNTHWSAQELVNAMRNEKAIKSIMEGEEIG